MIYVLTIIVEKQRIEINRIMNYNYIKLIKFRINKLDNISGV